MTDADALELAISELEGKEDCLTAVRNLRRKQLALRREEREQQGMPNTGEVFACCLISLAIITLFVFTH